MIATAHLRKGWCPGALRPMQSGDGLIVRVRPRAGALSLSALRVIASIAGRFGSGEIDLTNRGNLQLRGITDTTWAPALAGLADAGLLDESADAEAVRNVVVDPLSGIDPARRDVRGLAAEIEALLASDPRLWSLPSKFGFSVSGNSTARVGQRSSDVMIFTIGSGFAISLDGAEDVCCELATSDEAADAAHRLALAFIDLQAKDGNIRRMRDAVSRVGAIGLFASAGLRASTRARVDADAMSCVGLLASDQHVFGAGIGLPFGRITATELHDLCAVAKCEVAHTSPERVLLFPTADQADASALLRHADTAGLITKADDIRLAMDVCPGAPACANASTQTRRDAQRFAETWAGSLGGWSVHISGCEKGCARRTDAQVTFVGRGGRYDVIANGSAQSQDVRETIGPNSIGATVARLMTEHSS
jgi:precorrin-3B synthase